MSTISTKKVPKIVIFLINKKLSNQVFKMVILVEKRYIIRQKFYFCSKIIIYVVG